MMPALTFSPVPSGLRRRLRGAAAALAVLALVAAVLAPAVSAQSRSIGTVVIANGWSSADSAVASALAALESNSLSNAVVLYANSTQLTTRTANFIRDRQPSAVILVGGTAALSTAVHDEVVALVSGAAVRRIEGTDRFDTAAKAVPSNATTFIVANGYSAADTGVAAALAATRANAAVLLATADSLTGPTERIISERQPAQVEFVGGTVVLAASLADRVRELAPSVASVPRHSGASRTDTAAAAAPNTSTTLVIANGWSPADMGVAAAYAAVTSGSAVLYSQASSLTAPTERRIEAVRPRAIVLVGGSAVLDTSLHARLRTLAPAAALHRISGSDRIDTAVRAAAGTLTPIGTDPPAAPTSLTASARNAGLAVSWSAPTSGVGAAVSGYVLEYRACTATDTTCASSPRWGGWTAHAHSGTGTSTTISGLVNGTAYQVRVRARNLFGIGSWSQTASGIPGTQTARPSVPSGVTAEAANQQMQVSWNASTPPSNGTLTGYDVQYRACPSGSGCGSWTSHPHSGTSTSTTISRLSNGTRYEVQVRATSSRGDSNWSRTASATPADLPGFPAGPALEAGDRKITVRWNEPVSQTPTVTGYEVGYRACTATNTTCPTGDNAPSPTWGSWRTRSVSRTALTTDISGLKNGTKYQVRVRARSSNGVGPWSDATASIPVAAPSAPPRLAVDVGHQTLLVTWDKPFDNGSSITGYTMQHCDTTATGGCSGETNWTPSPGTAVDASSTSSSISSLTNGKTYRVRVRATNVKGSSSWSSASGRPAAVPNAPAAAPTLTPSPRQLAVSWDAPGNDNGSAITGYQLVYRACTAKDKTCPTGENDPAPTWGSWNTRSVSGTGTTANLTSLTNGTAYEVRVRARNANGLGPRSPVAKQTPRGLPAKPTSLTVESRHTALLVTWTKPSDGGSPFSGFDIQSCDTTATGGCSGDTNWTDGNFNDNAEAVTERSTTRLSHTISGLTNDTLYRVRVRAQTAAGDGPWSSLASGRPAAVPNAPTLNDPATQVSDRTIKVLWTAPDTTGSPITGYVVGWRACTAADKACPSGEGKTPTWGTWRTLSASSTADTAAITGLANGTKYQVRVRARNANGLSEWTDHELARAMATPRAGPATPTALTVDVDSTQLVVSWIQPSSGATESPTGYDVQYQKCTATPTTCASSPRWGSWTQHDHSGTGTTATIASLTNGTAYRVQVRAKSGSGSSSVVSAWTPVVSAIPAAVPAAPAVPTLTINPRQINTSWSAPADRGSTVIDYVLAWRACTAADKTCPTGDGKTPTWGSWRTRSLSGTQWSLDGLTNGTKYEVRVRARNANGFGPWSLTANEVPLGVPAKPSTPRVTAVDPDGESNRYAGTRLQVDWIAPWDNGSAITEYEVQHRACTATPLSCTSSPTWAAWPDNGATATTTTHTLGSLTNGTAYEVRVRATNGVGTGPWSSTITGIPVGKPSAPESVDIASGNRSLILSWSAPAANGATVTGFKVRYCTGSCDSSTDWTTRTVSGASRRTYTISSLTNDTAYKVQLLTTSRNKGDSGWSAEQTPKPGGPNRPSAPRLASGGSGAISVTWTAPSQNHSVITGYSVQYRACTGSSSSCTSTWSGDNVDQSGTNTTATITSLNNGTRYVVRVRATNAQGSSLWSSTAAFTPTG